MGAHLLVDIKGGVVAEDHAAREVVLRHGVMLQIIHPRLLTPCQWPSSVLCYIRECVCIYKQICALILCVCTCMSDTHPGKWWRAWTSKWERP